MVLPAVLALAGAAFSIGAVASAKVQCQSAAHHGARAAMVDAGQAGPAARKIAGAGAAVTASRAGDWVTVRVGRTVTVAGFSLTVSGSASARAEESWP